MTITTVTPRAIHVGTVFDDGSTVIMKDWMPAEHSYLFRTDDEREVWVAPTEKVRVVRA